MLLVVSWLCYAAAAAQPKDAKQIDILLNIPQQQAESNSSSSGSSTTTTRLSGSFVGVIFTETHPPMKWICFFLNIPEPI